MPVGEWTEHQSDFSLLNYHCRYLPFWVIGPLCLSSYSALHFYQFLVYHPVNWVDRHLLTHAMASDFSVA
jgi:hypothetical protein